VTTFPAINTVIITTNQGIQYNISPTHFHLMLRRMAIETRLQSSVPTAELRVGTHFASRGVRIMADRRENLGTPCYQLPARNPGKSPPAGRRSPSIGVSSAWKLLGRQRLASKTHISKPLKPIRKQRRFRDWPHAGTFDIFFLPTGRKVHRFRRVFYGGTALCPGAL